MVHFTVAVLLLALAPRLHAQDPKDEIQKRLTSQFVLTKTTADGKDIVGDGGSVLVLHQDGMIMFSLDNGVMPAITYNNGKLSLTFKDRLAANMGLKSMQTGINFANVPQRKFVTGEKFWITAFHVTDKHVLLDFYSDPYDNVRYFGQLKIPYKKNNIPPPDEVMTEIAQVVTVEPADNAAAAAATKKPAASPAAPKTIALGQTKDQVESIFGQPPKKATLGAKEIYYYQDMKVTFVDGKVTDVN